MNRLTRLTLLLCALLSASWAMAQTPAQTPAQTQDFGRIGRGTDQHGAAAEVLGLGRSLSRGLGHCPGGRQQGAQQKRESG